MHSFWLSVPAMLEMSALIGDIFEVAKEAGRHLAKGQKISQETLDIVSLELMPTEKYVQVVTSI
ncbi:MAG: hypothetical protein AB9861_00750 [Methanosarcina sp.]